MLRSVNSRHEEEDEYDGEFVSRTSDASSQQVKLDGKSSDQKAHVLRSKHSETEQRRRSKINERFQILRDLIPQNDQKRDKASFLLEVIQYIQFLQEKLQIYEGTYQSWRPECSKLMPWGNSCEPVESFLDQPHPQLVRDCSFQVETNSPLLGDAQNPMECHSSDSAYKVADAPSEAVAQAISPNLPLQPHLFSGLSGSQRQESFSSPENLASVSQSQVWRGKSCTIEHLVPYSADEQDELKNDSGDSILSHAYSQGLLNTLTHALKSSGVDLSQANISVQLDVGRNMSSGSPAPINYAEDRENYSGGNHVMRHSAVGRGSNLAFKRLRTEES